MPTSDWVADRARAHAKKGTYWGVGKCLKFARTAAGANGGVLDAITAWREADHRHGPGSTPPRGAPVYWKGGRPTKLAPGGHGHVAISEGGGVVWSTDIKRAGRVDLVSLSHLAARWPNLRLVGWAETVNDSGRITGLVPNEALMVRLTNLRPGATDLADVRDLQRALRRHGFGKFFPHGVTGDFDAATRKAVAAFQMSEPSLRGDADGIPGPRTVALLGLHLT